MKKLKYQKKPKTKSTAPKRTPHKSRKKKTKVRMAKPDAGAPLKVAKFGGSSLATAERIAHVADIVAQDPARRFIVLSAPGKVDAKDTKVTDLLIHCAQEVLAGNGGGGHALDTVNERFQAICDTLSIHKATSRKLIQNLDKVIQTPHKNKKAYMDSVKAMGEDMMARIFAAYLSETKKMPAQYVGPKEAGLLVTDDFGDAYPLAETTDNLQRHLSALSGIVVFPGFYGMTRDGDIATFSRGGSDLTGALLAEALEADVYENWTDVDGICRTDPAVVRNPEIIHELTFREMRELAYMGFNVLHHEAIMPVRRKHIPINLRNVNNIEFPGTTILEERIPLDEIVVGIAMKKNFCCFTVEKYLMNREVGFGRKLLSILEDFSLTFEHMPSGIDTISIYLDQKQLKPDMAAHIIRRIYKELDADRVEVEHDRAMVIAVGEGMKAHVGVAARLVGALSKSKINIHMINQGASELSILFGVRAESAEAAVKAIYKEYFGTKKSG